MDAEAVKLVVQLTSTAVALIALYVSFRNERRNHERFQQQLDLSRRVAEGNARPLLALSISAYDDHKALELTNHGSGTAVISNVVIRRGKRTAGSVPDVLDLGRDIVWNDFTDFGDSIVYVPPRASEVLIDLTYDHLIEQGFSEEDAASQLEELEQQIDEIRVSVTYEDVLGNVIAEDEELS